MFISKESTIENDREFEEKQTKGGIKWKIYKYFFKTKKLFILQLGIGLFFLIAESFVCVSFYFLSHW